MNLNRIFFVSLFLMTVVALLYIGSRESRRGAFSGAADLPGAAHAGELYIMATMYSAHPVLKPDLYYFKEQGKALGVRTRTVGPPDNNLELYVEAIEGRRWVIMTSEGSGSWVVVTDGR